MKKGNTKPVRAWHPPGAKPRLPEDERAADLQRPPGGLCGGEAGAHASGKDLHSVCSAW